MMEGLLLVCLTGICNSPEPFLFFERPIAVPRPVSERIVAQSTTIEAPSVLASSEAQATPPSGGRPTSREAITEIVKERADAIRRCYELGLVDDPTFKGTIEMAWKIDVAGHVTSATVVGANDSHPLVEACLRTEILRWTFPASSEPVVVGAYPFVFDAALLRHREPHARPGSPR